MALYLRPERLEDALDALGSKGLTVLAGGTDFYPARVGKPLDEDVLDITALAELRGIRDDGDCWRLGAGLTWGALRDANLPRYFDGLKGAAWEIGGPQVQNTGTIVGNICNASPAADGVPNLMALDAKVELATTRGRRDLALADFITGNRATLRRPDELVTAISIPKPAADTASSFAKLGARRYLVISIVMLAVVIEPEDGHVASARLALGACSPVAQRLPALEAALRGRALDGALGEALEDAHLEGSLAPIDDIRASADYRRAAAATLIRRVLSALGSSLGAQT